MMRNLFIALFICISGVLFSQKRPLGQTKDFSGNLKSTSIQTQKLDSVLRFMYNSKTDSFCTSITYHYKNAKGLDTLVILYFEDSQKHNKIPISKYTLQYDGADNITLETDYSWRNNKWVVDSKWEAEFNRDSYKTLDKSYLWDTIKNVWVGIDNHEIYYDKQNHDTLELYYIYDTITNNWINSTKYSYKYDSNFNDTLKSEFHWDIKNNKWINYSRTVKYFDNNNKDTLELYYKNIWTLTYKIEHQYNSKGQETLAVKFDWRNLIWNNSQKDEYSYDENGNDTSHITYNWYNTGSKWIYYSKTSSRYNLVTNKVTRSEKYRWIFSDNLWQGSNNTQITYNVNGDELIHSEYVWRSSDRRWVIFHNDFYYYSSGNTTSIRNLQNTEQTVISLFPNPLINQLNIKSNSFINSITVFDMHSKLIQVNRINSKEGVINYNLKDGIYLLKIDNEKGFETRKIIVGSVK